uniref:Uncharacterized protein n=1 Tax=Cacopsylla melanoneura TaxID=428564 RepID=A0A8D9EI67_9HEMI
MKKKNTSANGLVIPRIRVLPREDIRCQRTRQDGISGWHTRVGRQGHGVSLARSSPGERFREPRVDPHIICPLLGGAGSGCNAVHLKRTPPTIGWISQKISKPVVPRGS